MRVLLVEDDRQLGDELAAAFRAHGFTCDVVTNTCDAFSLLRRRRYDVAVLDLALEDETTVFLTSYLRLRHPEIRIVTLTCASMIGTTYGLQVLDSDFLFRKPMAVSDLIAVVSYLGATEHAKDDVLTENTAFRDVG